MKTLIAVFFVDSTTHLDLVVYPPSTPTTTPSLKLLKLTIDSTTGPSPTLQSPVHGDLEFAQPNQLRLDPGVYFFATDRQIKYSITSGNCRVGLQSGKDPWPAPPPPAPQGTDLKMWEEVYKAMFSDLVTAVSATTATTGKPWIVVALEEKLAS
jgi:hypothetical protein